MRLSVIVPVYNTEAYLLRCVQSLFDQGLDEADFEVVAVNDGSTDGSRAVLEGLAAAHANIVIRNQANQGLSASRNAAMAIARGKYLCFVDSDDYVAPGVFGALLDRMDREALQVLGYNFREIDPNGESRPQRYYWDRAIAPTTGLQFMQDEYYSNSAWWYLIEREYLAQLGLQFEVGVLLEDAVFTARLLAKAERFGFEPADVYRWCIHRPGSITSTRTEANMARLIAGYERVVFGLQELRAELGAGSAQEAAVAERLAYRQQAYVFFMIGKYAQSSLPLRPLLPTTLRRIRAIGAYPMDVFPGADHPGLLYRVLAFVNNRETLLFTMIIALRSASRLLGLARWVLGSLTGRGKRVWPPRM